MPKARIDQQFVQKARHAPGFHWDSGPGAIRGFGVRCDKAGRPHSYVYQARGLTRVALGKLADISLNGAREAAHALAAKKPKARVRKSDPTLREAMAAHLADMRIAGCSERSIALMEDELTRYVGDALARKLGSFHHGDLKKLHQSTLLHVNDSGEEKRRPVAANRLMRHLSACFHTARVEFPLDRKEFRKFRAKENRNANPPVDDLAAFGAALRKLRNPIVRAWWQITLLTALRFEDSLSIRRDEVDARRKGWVYRPDPKGGETVAFDVPLPTQAQRIVAELPAFGDNPYLFPSTRLKGDHLKNPGEPMGVNAHRLRSSWATRAAEIGAPMQVIKAVMNHGGERTPTNVTEGYIHVTPKMVALWSQRVADSLWAELEGSTNQNATPEIEIEAMQKSANVH